MMVEYKAKNKQNIICRDTHQNDSSLASRRNLVWWSDGKYLVGIHMLIHIYREKHHGPIILYTYIEYMHTVFGK